jgi:hypothetical protein
MFEVIIAVAGTLLLIVAGNTRRPYAARVPVPIRTKKR